jgi:hypothetical protein
MEIDFLKSRIEVSALSVQHQTCCAEQSRADTRSDDTATWLENNKDEEGRERRATRAQQANVNWVTCLPGTGVDVIYIRQLGCD